MFHLHEKKKKNGALLLEATLNCLLGSGIAVWTAPATFQACENRTKHANNKARSLRGVMGALRGIAWGSVGAGGVDSVREGSVLIFFKEITAEAPIHTSNNPKGPLIPT